MPRERYQGEANPFEVMNRQRKARAITRALIQMAPDGMEVDGILDVVRRMNPGQKEAVCRAANQNVASEKTWSVVRSLLREWAA